MGFLDSLSSGGNKTVVSIAVTPGIGLEIAVLDKDGRTVSKYGRKKIEYDISRREILDIEEFKRALGDLTAQMQLVSSIGKQLAYLSLPNVYFDFVELSNEITEKEEISTAILSEAGEFYLFKKEEPVCAFSEVVNYNSDDKKKYVYSAFQEEHIKQLKAAIADCGYKLIGIETNYCTTLRGLYTLGYVNDVIMDDQNWSAMIINTNSFVMMKMEGSKLLGVLEVPLAVKGYSVDEAYEAITSNASQILEDYQSAKLFIISQVDEISADVVKRKIKYSNEIITVESNKYGRDGQLTEIKQAADFSDTNCMTLSVLGAGVTSSGISLSLNLLQNEVDASLGIYNVEIFGQPRTIAASAIQSFFIIVMLIFGGIFGGIYLVFNKIDTDYQKQIEESNQQIQTLDAQLAELQKDGTKEEINIFNIIDEIAEANVTALRFYDSIATDIPAKVWLTTYYNKNGNSLAVRGIAENIKDVYEYYKNLKIVSPDSGIKLNELKVFTNDEKNAKSGDSPESARKENFSNLLIEDSDRLYSFEISNIEINDKVIEEKDESQIITKAAAAPASAESTGEGEVEQTSQVMKPVKKRKKKNAKIN